MEIEFNEKNDPYNEDRLLGTIAINHEGKDIGLLEYYVQSGSLHVVNLINNASDQYAGVGSALMNSAIQKSLNERLGFAFEVARGSEPFYKAWLTKTFNSNIDKRTFDRIATKNLDCSYSYDHLKKHFLLDVGSDFVAGVKAKEILSTKMKVTDHSLFAKPPANDATFGGQQEVAEKKIDKTHGK